MKKTVLTLIACLLVGLGATNASFPVKKERDAQKTELSAQDQIQNPQHLTNAPAVMQKQIEDRVEEAKSATRLSDDDWITLALWFFLGSLAAHRWYRRKPVGWNILYILTLGGCGVWAIIDLINILRGDF